MDYEIARPHNDVDGYSGPELDDVQKYLIETHGRSYVGVPSWRVVHTAHATVLSGGEWCDWDESIPVEKRG
jgi:hypothetical protein